MSTEHPNEQARLAALWLSKPLESIGLNVEPINWEEELPDMRHLATPEACIVYGKNATRVCMHCGGPVCINPTNYMAKSTCGDWIMDWWSNGAMDPDDGNEFWCVGCLAEEYGVDPEIWKSEKQEGKPAPTPAQNAVEYIEMSSRSRNEEKQWAAHENLIAEWHIGRRELLLASCGRMKQNLGIWMATQLWTVPAYSVPCPMR